MQGFYGHMLQDELDPDAALRATQLDYIGKADPNLSAPQTWAPHVLIGG